MTIDFRSLQNRRPLTDRQKIAWLIMSATSTPLPNLVQIRPYVTHGQMGEIQPNFTLLFFV